MATATEAHREEVRRRLREDFVFYPEEAVRIVYANGVAGPFKLKRPQIRMARGLMAQRASGEPMRAVVLKARKVGFSTQAQGLLIQRATQIPNHLAVMVAQDGDTAAEVFNIGRFMWANLPPQIQPTLAYERNTDRHKYMQFGEPSQIMRRQGLMGLNSIYRIQTAGTAQVAAKGRGLTIRSLHMSEVAFWEAVGKKLALINAVPDDEDTLIIEESTANGHNSFKDDWDAAVEGSSGYLPIFTPWFEEPGYRRRFANDMHRASFEAQLYQGPWGEDEYELMDAIPRALREWADEWDEPAGDVELATLECLNWRRWAITAKCESSVDKFHQEYPSSADEAFLATGRKVFRPEHVAKVLKRAQITDPPVPKPEQPGPAVGLLRGTNVKTVRVERGVTIEVPQKALWVPRSARADDEHARWRMWAAPKLERVLDDGKQQPAGQYIVSCDPMSGEENEGELAEHAITVIDHRTLRLVAEYYSRDDPDQVALECLLAALLFNRALIAVEVTGGWGSPIVARLARTYRYPRLFMREVPDKRTAKHLDKIGWSTDHVTKPMMEARATELIRDEVDGIRSRKIASQMLTYIRDERGRSKPEAKKLADGLMSWMIGQRVAEMTPIRPDRPRGATTYGSATTSTKPKRQREREDTW